MIGMKYLRILSLSVGGFLLFAAGVYCGNRWNSNGAEAERERRYTQPCAYPGCGQPARSLLGNWASHELPSCPKHRSLWYSLEDHMLYCELTSVGLSEDDAHVCLTASQRMSPVIHRAKSCATERAAVKAVLSDFSRAAGFTPELRYKAQDKTRK